MVKIIRKMVGQLVRGVASLPLPNGHYCCVCRSKVARFLPYMRSAFLPYRQPPLLTALQAVGSDIRNFTCPRCGAHDRERHLFLYLEATGLGVSLSNARILHFAPEPKLSSLIRRSLPAEYVMGDLFPSEAEIEAVDIQAINYADESFDFVIANHVLEHVQDEKRALAEIRRVLRAGGHAILQTPYSAALTRKFEDPGIATPQARLQAYGQEDHVRLFGRDIFARFADSGLVDRSVRHQEALPLADARLHGVNAAEPFFLFQRPPAPVRA